MNQTHEFEKTSDGQLIAECFVYGRVCVYALMLSKERGLTKVYQSKLASTTLSLSPLVQTNPSLVSGGLCTEYSSAFSQ